jgi:hypothetical protein
MRKTRTPAEITRHLTQKATWPHTKRFATELEKIVRDLRKIDGRTDGKRIVGMNKISVFVHWQ